MGDLDLVGEEWLDREASRLNAHVTQPAADAGLLASMALLDHQDFAPELIHKVIRDFYERTARWRLDAWVGWSPIAWPVGWLLSTVFARRLQQLALPLRSLDLTHGMTSTVVPIQHESQQIAAMWLRRLRSTGATVFSGLYRVVRLPATGEPAVQVVFPLPLGRLVVVLRPESADNGDFVLASTGSVWGGPGAYLVVERGGRSWARQVPLHERFHLYIDDEQTLRTDHHLWLGRMPVVRLHYRLTQ